MANDVRKAEGLRAELMPEKPERVDFRPEGPEEGGGRTNERTDG